MGPLVPEYCTPHPVPTCVFPGYELPANVACARRCPIGHHLGCVPLRVGAGFDTGLAPVGLAPVGLAGLVAGFVTLGFVLVGLGRVPAFCAGVLLFGVGFAPAGLLAGFVPDCDPRGRTIGPLGTTFPPAGGGLGCRTGVFGATGCSRSGVIGCT